MKNLFLVIAVLAMSAPVFAHKHELSILKIRLSDDSRITVAIDGRHYRKEGRSLTIGDLPAGRHFLTIYKFFPYRDDDAGRARTIYNGSIKLEGGLIVSLVYDPHSRDMQISSRHIGEDASADQVVTQEHDETEETSSSKDDVYSNGSLSSSDLNGLQLKVADKVTDSDKQKTLRSSLGSRTYTTEQVRTMMGWLGFESSRLDFAKWAYDNVTDKQNYDKLSDGFEFDGSKKEFKTFLDAKKK